MLLVHMAIVQSGLLGPSELHYADPLPTRILTRFANEFLGESYKYFNQISEALGWIPRWIKNVDLFVINSTECLEQGGSVASKLVYRGTSPL
jgi:hypothetical protein